MADSTISENLFKPTREAIPEEFLNKLIRLSRKYEKRRNGTAVSREIAELLKMRFPEKEEALDILGLNARDLASWCLATGRLPNERDLEHFPKKHSCSLSLGDTLVMEQ